MGSISGAATFYIDEYRSFLTDIGGSAASMLQGLSDGERTTLKAQLAAALAPFAVGGGLELPSVALSAVAT